MGGGVFGGRGLSNVSFLLVINFKVKTIESEKIIRDDNFMI